MNKVLYISYDGMTDPLGQSQVIPYLVGLSETYDITLISCEKAERLTRVPGVKETLASARIKWLPLPYKTFPPVISRFLNVSRMYALAKKQYKKKPFNIVHCRSYMAALAGLKLKRKYGIRFIFDMRGFWADERIDGGIWNKKNPVHNALYRYFKQKEKQFLDEADAIVSLTHNGKKELLSWENGKIFFNKIQVIPCCVDVSYFSGKDITPQKKAGQREQLNIKDTDFILSYLGSFSTWYLPEEMMAFFKRLLISHPSARFLFITQDDKELIVRIAKNAGVEEKRIIVVSADREEVPLFLSISNASIFFIKPAYSKIASSPVKMGEILSMGIPLICNSGVGDVEKIINETDAGLLVHKFNDKEYDRVIGHFEELLKIKKEQIIDAAHKHYSLQDGINAYDNIYKSLSK